mgnify:CR=1 FL=1
MPYIKITQPKLADAIVAELESMILEGSLQPGRAVWDYRDFTGTVGQSDLHGHLRFASGAPRGKLSGSVTSRQLLDQGCSPSP